MDHIRLSPREGIMIDGENDASGTNILRRSGE